MKSCGEDACTDLRVAADLKLQDCQAGTKIGQEEIVEDLAPLLLGVLDQQPGGAAGGEAAVAVELGADLRAVDDDGRRGAVCERGGRAGAGASAGKQKQR